MVEGHRSIAADAWDMSGMLGRNNGMSLRWGALLACLAPALLMACSSEPNTYPDRKSTFPVKGKVLVNGQPAAGATVLLYPVNEPPEPVDPRPVGTVQEDGTFQLRTYDEADGAIPGEYRATITWGGESPDEPDRLGGRYRDPATSKFQVTVKEGENELPPFQLQ